MNKETIFKVASWGTIIVCIFIIFNAFNPDISDLGVFYSYLLFISGIIGIVGAIFSLGIFPVIGGLAISGGMMVISVQDGFDVSTLIVFLEAILLIIGGSGMILTYEEPLNLLSTDLSRLNIGKTEYFELKALGITNLKELVEEKGHEGEICSITSISVPELKDWIRQAEHILQEVEKTRKSQLQKDYKKKFKK
ncbi:MAG: hypothetical protein HWN65_10870 [Candidatus Helarchaeota archaeon]|nr:hypothetical protein [Candidatus Helarchaeota archaeon]